MSARWATQRSFLIKTYNWEVKRWFRDILKQKDGTNGLDDGRLFGDNPVPNTNRVAVVRACLIASGDSQNMALIKMETFRRVVQKTHLRPHVYGIPTQEFQNLVKFQPQIILHFLQDSQRTYTKHAAEGRISFRLADETYKTINNAKALTLANAVKREFMTGNGYVWSKGRKMAAYQDWNRGYRLKLLYFNETEVKALIKKVLSIQGDTMQEKYLNLGKNSDELTAFPGIPETETILGKIEKLPQRRPVVDVRFTHAELHIWGRQEPVILCDRTYRYVNPIVDAA